MPSKLRSTLLRREGDQERRRLCSAAFASNPGLSASRPSGLDDEPDIGHKLTRVIRNRSWHFRRAAGLFCWNSLANTSTRMGQTPCLLRTACANSWRRTPRSSARPFGLDRPSLREALRQVEVHSSQEVSDHQSRLLREDEQSRLFGGGAQISLSEESATVPSTKRTQSARLVEMLRLAERDGEGPASPRPDRPCPLGPEQGLNPCRDCGICRVPPPSFGGWFKRLRGGSSVVLRFPATLPGGLRK